MSNTRCVVILISQCLMAALSAPAQEGPILRPLGKDWAGDEPRPRPIGIGVTYYYQKQDYSLTRVAAGGAGAMAALGALGGGGGPAMVPDSDGMVTIPDALLTGIQADNYVHEVNVKIDAWILPFLNVFGLVGSVDGETEAVGLPLPLPPSLKIDYDGVVYGGGATVAGGVGAVFGSFTATYTGTSLDGSTSSLSAWIFAPKAGVRLAGVAEGVDLSVWIGAVYQELEERQEGRLDATGLGPVQYDVDFEQDDAWNYAIGISATLNTAWQIDLEAGFGNRTHAAAALSRRF